MVKFVVKYFDTRMLSTVNINALFKRLVLRANEQVTVVFEQMNEDEKKSVVREDEGIIVGIQERFWVFIEDDSGVMIRQKSLEAERKTPVPAGSHLWLPNWPIQSK